ncbi:hydrogenase maturation protease [Chloroflexota bacterium]
MPEFPTLVIGLGNPILGDDGVGWIIAEKLSKLLSERTDLEFEFLSLGGLALMERLEGYEKVIIIDAICSGKKPKGFVHYFPLNELPDRSSGHTTAAHDTNLRTALEVGRSMGIVLPKENNIIVIGIEAENVYDFSEDLSPAVEESIPNAIDLFLSVI